MEAAYGVWEVSRPSKHIQLYQRVSLTKTEIESERQVADPHAPAVA
jgi:hypothetical protein